MDLSKAREILKRYNEGTCSDEEKEWVESWYLKQVDRSEDVEISRSELDKAKQRILENIFREKGLTSAKRNLYPKVAVAASILLAVGAAFYFSKPIFSLFNDPKPQVAYKEVLPGGEKAYLTLSDGKKIDLNNVKKGEVIGQPGIKIIKTSEGELVYEILEEKDVARSGTRFNTIETPQGGQFQVSLPDGTKVWLNASSSLKYPVRFAADQRSVEITGEAYFEVKPDKTRPFKVLSKDQLVEVLGTHFNVNTYSDEPVSRTTLIEGRVRVTGDNDSKILKPGEQASMSSSGLQVNTVDIEQSIAWHKGDFAFEGTELRAIMRQLARWYNVEVVYEGNIGDVKFGGSISRSKNINEVLKVLEMTKGVSFKLEGRRILVMP